MNSDTKAALSALEWYVDNGVTDALEDAPVDKTKTVAPTAPQKTAPQKTPDEQPASSMAQALPQANKPAPSQPQKSGSVMGTPEAIKKATELAKAATSLDELRETIANCDGLSVKKTAQNLVFSDGNPQAKIMVIGEAPGADEDEQGKPFVGSSGQLLDKILGSIGLSRTADNANDALYISNILNWRPPGNRTPTPAEMSIALPFIERHIQLVSPRILILVGNTPMKSLLDTKEGIVKMRGKWHDYETVTDIGGTSEQAIIALPTFHPAYLLRNPKKKKTVWQDMIFLQKKRVELGLAS